LESLRVSGVGPRQWPGGSAREVEPPDRDARPGIISPGVDPFLANRSTLPPLRVNGARGHSVRRVGSRQRRSTQLAATHAGEEYPCPGGRSASKCSWLQAAIPRAHRSRCRQSALARPVPLSTFTKKTGIRSKSYACDPRETIFDELRPHNFEHVLRNPIRARGHPEAHQCACRLKFARALERIPSTSASSRAPLHCPAM